MNLIINIISALVFSLFGFGVGRLGDKYGGQIKGPHHWTYGFILAVTGFVYFNYWFGIPLIAFGAGHFISDLNDFLHGKIWGVDESHEWKFWSIK